MLSEVNPEDMAMMANQIHKAAAVARRHRVGDELASHLVTRQGQGFISPPNRCPAGEVSGAVSTAPERTNLVGFMRSSSPFFGSRPRRGGARGKPQARRFPIRYLPYRSNR